MINWKGNTSSPIKPATMSISKGLIGLILLCAVGSTLGADKEPPCYVEGLKCLPGAFNTLEAKNMEAICGSTAIVDCLESAKNKCTGTEAESAMNAVIVNYQNICTCTKKVHTCGGGIIAALKTPKPNSATFIKLCNKTEDMEQCLNESRSSCPPPLFSMWQKALGVLIVGCKHAACFAEVERCGGKAMKALLDAKKTYTPGSFGLDMAESICSDRDLLVGCFNASVGICPEVLATQWDESLKTVSKACGLIPCVKKIGACGSGFAGIFKKGIMSDPKTHFGNNTFQELCRERDNLTACINSSTPECPSTSVRQWSDQLHKMTVGCDMQPCIKKISDCGSKLAAMLKRGMMSDPKSYILVNNGALQDLCSERENLSLCINSSTPECPSQLAQQWSSQLNKMTPSCDLLPCTKQLDVCHRNLSKALMKPLSDAAALNTVCNEFDGFNMCVRNATECPSTMRTNFTIMPEKYKSACTKIAECSYSLQNCAGESSKTFIQTIRSGKFDITAAEELCNVEERLVSCFNQSSTCPRDYLTVLKGSLSKMREYCQNLPCAKKVQQCGASMFDGIDIRKLNKETLITFCSNVVDVENCLATVGNECPEDVSEKWKKPMKTWADRCTAIVKRYRCDQHKCKNDGTCVATVAAASCRCKKGFKGDYCEIDISLQTTTVTVQAPGGHGSTITHTGSVILASVGASLLLAAQHDTSVV